MKTRGLTPKQSAFAAEYLVDMNASAAARRAGYSERTAEWIGPQLLGKSHVAAAVADGMAKRAKRTEITQDRVLQELARVAFLDPGKLFGADGAPIAVKDLDEDTRRAVAGLDVVTIGNADAGIGQVQKIKLADKLAALEKVGKHLGMFTDKLQVTGDVKVTDPTQRAARVAYLMALAEKRKAGSGS